MANTTLENSINVSEVAKKTLCFHGIWAWLCIIISISLIILFVLWLVRKFIQGPFYRKDNRIDGKVVIVTGCNTGLGKETVLELARRGAKIYMACRDPARCEAARIEIMERTQNQQLFNRSLDLGSLESVHNFVEGFMVEESRLDILINNAGIMACPHSLTADGFEQQLGVNHLGHFLLTNLLLEHLKKSAPSRIVVLSSVAHLFGRINRDDLMSEHAYSKWGSYFQSKLANVLFTRKLAMLLLGSGVTINCCHPGLVRTELNRHFAAPSWFRKFLSIFSLYFVKSPRAGAQTTLRLALDPVLATSTGGFYADCMQFPLVPWASDNNTADWLWHESERIVNSVPRMVQPVRGQTEDSLHTIMLVPE